VKTVPVLVTPPAAPLVSLADMKQHLRVTHDEEDMLIQGLTDAAMAYLDGWSGVLGRTIQSQEWQQEFDGWGRLCLALPDVTGFALTAYDEGDVTVLPDEATLSETSAGAWIDCSGTATVTRVVVAYTAAMPAQLLPVAEQAVKLIVGHWYRNREAVSGDGATSIPLSAQALIGAMSRVRP
jgi:uncharacterized phiE125 gp8 family phage protein